jgi:D-glycero-D-manno-heptose 1,7-bisphosphate phosphatase
MAKPLVAVFLDRDGVLIEDRHYLFDPDGVALMPGARDLIGRLRQAGVKLFLVTNQSGVARGMFPIEAVAAVNSRMFAELGGGQFSGVAICPHHPEGIVEQYTRTCNCRKPAPGMIEQFVTDFALDRACCCMIGDKQSDMEAAGAAGISGFLFPGGDLCKWFDRVVLQEGGFSVG